MNKNHIYFYLKKNATPKLLMEQHPEFVERPSGVVAYLPEGSKSPLLLIKERRGARHRFRYGAGVGTHAVFKLMELYKEGWIEASAKRDDRRKPNRSSHKITKEEWEMVKRLRKGEK